MPLTPGSRIGPYEIVGWLGAGAMGEVYRARDARLGRDVAIKLIPDLFARDPARLHRFEQEARAAGQLNHPNILAVFDIGTHGGAPYIVSELLEGESLRGRLQAGGLPSRKAIDYARQIAEGLAAAHDRGIVHRDVKPDNVFVTNEGRVKILDFGIAKLTRPADGADGQTAAPTETDAGTVLGTAGYMSPEQVRGETVDGRSDLFSFGAILYEMLSGVPAFSRPTAAESMTAVLKEEPPARPLSDMPALERIVSRCLEKSRGARFQSARDLAFALEVLSGPHAAQPAAAGPGRRWPLLGGAAVAMLGLSAAAAGWLTRDGAAPPALNALDNARFSPFTDWPGTEGAAEISPDGRFVVFVADRDGEFDLFMSQVGTRQFTNLTRSLPALGAPSVILRSFAFTGDGADIWYSPLTLEPGDEHFQMPFTGGPSRPFMTKGDEGMAWSPDGARLVYFRNGNGDPLFIADATGADPRPIVVDEPQFFGEGQHNHNPVWSADGAWIYFVHGRQTSEMDIWRVRPSGGAVERMTQHSSALNYLAPIDARTLLYVGRAEDRSGPWLWALDVERRSSRRVTSGLEHYTSVSASRDGRRVAATVASSSAGLWRVPLGDGVATDRDVEPYPLPTSRAVAPRFGGGSLFYLSGRGAGDGLSRFRDGQAADITSDADGGLSEPAAVSPDGSRVAVVVRQQGRWRVSMRSADGTSPRTLPVSFDLQTSGGQGTLDWSPDGSWIVAAGSDDKGPGLFKIPVAGGDPVRLVSGPAVNPVWSPDGKLIVYGGALRAGQVPLLGVRPDGTPVKLPEVRARIGGGHRFLRDSSGLIFLPQNQSLDFWKVDLTTGATRAVTRLGSQGALHTFDITPDGRFIIFDRTREQSNIVLIELPKG